MHPSVLHRADGFFAMSPLPSILGVGFAPQNGHSFRLSATSFASTLLSMALCVLYRSPSHPGTSWEVDTELDVQAHSVSNNNVRRVSDPCHLAHTIDQGFNQIAFLKASILFQPFDLDHSRLDRFGSESRISEHLFCDVAQRGHTEKCTDVVNDIDSERSVMFKRNR